MTKRPKKQSLIELAITGDWSTSATFAFILFEVIYIIFPFVTNPLLKQITLSLKTAGLFVMWIFWILAFAKFVLQSKSNNQSKSNWVEPNDKPNWVEPSDTSLRYHRTDSSPLILGSLGNSQVSTVESLPTEWSLELIQKIEWKKFEELSTAYYLEKGITAKATSLGADGGIDIKLYQDDSGNPTSIVQCKAWTSKYVGVKEIREFLGVMTHEKIAKGFYMTSGEFSIDAKSTATANKITLINGELFLAMIKRLPEKAQQKLLALATEGDYTTPSCSSCGTKMIKRNGKRGEFWGCRNFPRCKQMLYVKAN